MTAAGNFHKILTMKAFITGGTGFIGSHLIDHYLSSEKDIEIFALVRDLNNLKWLKGRNINLLEGDLFSIPSLPSDIDYVFHLAGLTLASDLADYYTVNQRGTASLFRSLHSQKILPKKIVHLSSLSAAGPSSDCKPVKESSSPHPITPYGKSKLVGEVEALKFKDLYSIVILRATAIFGPRDTDFLNYFKFIKKGILPTICFHKIIINFCYVKDLVRAIDLSIQRELKSGEIINIANPRAYSWDDLGKAAGKAMGKSLKKLKIPFPSIYIIGIISEIMSIITKKPSLLNRYKIKEMKERCWIADVKKAEEKLSFYPHYSLQDAVQETINWYFQQKWL